MTIETVALGEHVAYLDPMTGEGLIAMPGHESDVFLPDAESLHAADWNSAVARLDAMGWEPTEGEDGGWCEVEDTDDGRTLLGLFGREPVITDPSIEECAEAVAELIAAARG